MQIAFSTHACNDWSLAWQGLKNKKLKTVLCFTAGAGEPASWSCMLNIFTSKASNLGRYSLIEWPWRGKATAQQRSGSYFLQVVDKIGHNKHNLAEKPSCCCCFFYVDDLTWFLVCCCALSLLLGCRGVSLGMGPIGVGCRKHEKTNTVKMMTSSEKSK